MRWKGVAAAIVGLAAAGGAAVGLIELNDYEDRDRAMYHDAALMAGLQWDLLRAGLPGIPRSFDDSTPPIRIGDTIFQAHPGVEVVVEARDGELCVRGSNEHGSETEWMCVDGTGQRP